jgi:hypothetical protein
MTVDINEVHKFMFSLKEINGNLAAKDARLREAILYEADTLDRADVTVLVVLNEEVREWQTLQGFENIAVDRTGHLAINIGGFDSDGAWGTVRGIMLPPLRWLRYETYLTPVPNPYFQGTQVPDTIEEIVE